VAIGRAIVRKPAVFLFDEPLSNLDAGLRVQMRVELSRLHSELKTTMVYVTHDQVEAMTLANRIVVINLGRIEQVGSPLELYHHPANLFVAGFLGSPKMNFLDCTLVSSQGGIAEVKLTGGMVVKVHADAHSVDTGGKLTLGIRPEHIDATPAPADGSVPGRVLVAEHLGDTTFLYLEMAGLSGSLTVKANPDNPLHSGDAAYLGFPADRCFLFDSQGRTLLATPPPS
jgi:multiple sugar transport system ATP-binding protein